MSTWAGVGRSHHPEAQVAAKEAVAMALARAHTREADVVVLFATLHHAAPDLVRGARAVLPHTRIAGCTAQHICADGLALKLFQSAPGRLEHIVAAMHHERPPWIGLHTFVEIGPIASQSRALQHATAILVAREDAAPVSSLTVGAA